MTLFIVSQEPGSTCPTLSVFVDGKKVAVEELTPTAAIHLIIELAKALRV